MHSRRRKEKRIASHGDSRIGRFIMKNKFRFLIVRVGSDFLLSVQEIHGYHSWCEIFSVLSAAFQPPRVPCFYLH